MKRLIIIPLFVIFSSLTTPSDRVQENSVKIEAEKLTDKQIDSVYKSVPITPYIDATRNDFKALRNHIDSLNKINILREEQIETDAIKRDSLTHQYLNLLIINQKLRETNANQQTIIKDITQMPNILYLFVLMFMASCLAAGVVSGIAQYKKKNEHV